MLQNHLPLLEPVPGTSQDKNTSMASNNDTGLRERGKTSLDKYPSLATNNHTGVRERGKTAQPGMTCL